MKRTIVIDASMSMSGVPLDRAVTHARAFEAPGTRAVAIANGRIAWDGIVQDLSHGTIEPLLAGPMLSDGMAEIIDIRDADATIVLYTDGYLEDLDAVVLMMTRGGSDTGNVMRVDMSAQDAKQAASHLQNVASRAKGLIVLPLPDATWWGKAPLDDIRNTLRHEAEHADAILGDFAASFAQDPEQALTTSARVFRATARRTAAARLLAQIDAIGTNVVGGSADPVTFDYVVGMWSDVVGEAVRSMQSRSSSATTDLMRQETFAAVWWADGVLKGRI